MRTYKLLPIPYRIGLVLLVVFAVYKVGSIFFSGGTDPFAETYELNAAEDDVIKAIESLKKQQPDFIPPSYLKEFIKVEGGKNDANKYLIYFYYKKENKVLETWIRPNNDYGTTLAFVAVNDNLSVENWKDGMNDFGWKTINDDYWFWENRKIKKEFEERIVAKIDDMLRSN